MRLAWLCLALAVPLRLAFFAGYGLGDDPNESQAIAGFANSLRLDPNNFMHYRVVNIVIRGVAYRLFSQSELAFVVPILVAALATHAMSIVLARELLGARAAFLISLLFLVTPYETLSSTANVPDYFLAFFAVAAAWAGLRGCSRDSPAYMALAAVFIALGLLSKLSAIQFIPPFGVAMLLTLRRWRAWVSFWTTLVALLALFCLADLFFSGSPVQWLTSNAATAISGHDVSNMLGFVLMQYPNYLFARDDFGHLMFGLTAWCGMFGIVLALVRVVQRRASMAEGLLLIAFFVFVGLFEFMPHRLTLHGYFSHPRIFRYLAPVAPVLYLSGAYFLDRTWDVRLLGRALRLGPLMCAAVAAVGLYQTPRVAEPLTDADRDLRQLLVYLRSHEQSGPVPIYTDYWRVDLMQALYANHRAVWTLNGIGAEAKPVKVSFLQAVPPGALVITGGATLPWYSGIELIVNLSTLDFTVPSHWKLLWEFDGRRTPWRVEPLRVWSVGAQ